ncbi:MAG: hypothetical protein ACI9G1_002054 [Pirellulaceae bacterium]|jgi:hypothetical protein
MLLYHPDTAVFVHDVQLQCHNRIVRIYGLVRMYCRSCNVDLFSLALLTMGPQTYGQEHNESV